MAAEQHGVIARWQLLELGINDQGIQHRLSRGRLHRVGRGVYAIGRPELTREGMWMAAVLVCGPRTVLSHHSAAALWGIGTEGDQIDVSVPASSSGNPPRVRVHRRTRLEGEEVDRHRRVPVTGIVRTLVDLAIDLQPARLERAISEADKLGLIDPETLRGELERYRGQPGARRLREILDRRTFRLTESDLEQRFLKLVRDLGLATPLTQQYLNGFRVDFYWPDLGLVVETDGLTYHRTPAQQARDRLRDQAHTAAGLTPLHFTHAQIRYETEYVRSTLRTVMRRLERERAA